MKKIYIGNLAYSVDEQTLDTSFSQFGPIKEVVVITDRATGRSKGFGFITFNTDEAAQAALSLNGQELWGRVIKVSLAREKKAIS